MALWLGRPGGLIALPDPDPGVEVPWSRPSVEHRLLAGGRVVDLVGAGRRSFALSWSRLGDDEYGLLDEFASGSRGPGPFLLIAQDARWNYLSAVQASATSATADTAGWAVSGGETLDTTVSDTIAGAPVRGPVLRGPRSLRWSLPSPTTSGRLALAPPAGLAGWPAVPGLAWTFTLVGQASPGGGIPLTVSGVLRWLDPAGTELSVSAGPAVTVPSGAWTTVTVAGVPPEGAWYLLPDVRVDPASVTVATRLYVDLPRLETGAVARSWLPGRGLPAVTITAVEVSYAWADVLDVSATFTEVG